MIVRFFVAILLLVMVSCGKEHPSTNEEYLQIVAASANAQAQKLAKAPSEIRVLVETPQQMLAINFLNHPLNELKGACELSTAHKVEPCKGTYEFDIQNGMLSTSFPSCPLVSKIALEISEEEFRSLLDGDVFNKKFRLGDQTTDTIGQVARIGIPLDEYHPDLLCMISDNEGVGINYSGSSSSVRFIEEPQAKLPLSFCRKTELRNEFVFDCIAKRFNEQKAVKVKINKKLKTGVLLMRDKPDQNLTCK